MKAAVIEKLGDIPQYKDVPHPEIQNENQIVLHVKAAAVKNLDKIRASGDHYASHKELPAIVGMDGVGVLDDGTRVYAQGLTGMIAEKALIDKNSYTVIPEYLDFSTAAALPNAVLGGAMALKVRGNMTSGQTVIINGATGVTGQLAVQLAKYYGAKNIIATGRNPENLEKTKGLGAHKTVSLKQEDAALIKEIQHLHQETPIDLVIDYLWGTPTELVLKALKGGGLNTFSHTTRIVTVGSMAGETINLDSGTLRSSGIEILGSGFGSLSKTDLENFHKNILPEMFQLAAEGDLIIELVEGDIKAIETLWEQKIASGKRLVITINQ